MMSTLRLAHPVDGTKPHPAPRVVPLLGQQIDHLLELRTLLKEAEQAERTLTGELVRAFQAQGFRSLAGSQAVAILDDRTTLTVDPELFHEALGPAAFPAMTVSVTQARKLLGADDLAAISDTRTTPVLRVEPIPTCEQEAA